MKNSLQKQLRRLLWVLVAITGVNALFFWKTLDGLFKASKDLSKVQKFMGAATELERHLFAESKYKQGAQDSRKAQLLKDVQTQIKSDLKFLQDTETDKSQAATLRDIKAKWPRAYSEDDYLQLLSSVRKYVAHQKSVMAPLEKTTQDATKATVMYLLIYVAIFGLTAFVLGQYFRQRLFSPINKLSDKMKHYQAGHYELPHQVFKNNEIGYLESQFYEMAKRMSATVDELKELDRVKTDFLSIASHELRTPMTAVKGSLSLILSGSVSQINDDIKEILSITEKETDRLIRLINDILDLTKMEAKKMPLDKKWHSIDDVMVSAVNGITGLFEVAKVSVEIQSTNPPLKAHVDRDRIQQVITNLLSNAIKFSPQGSTVILSCQLQGTSAVIAVTDQGPGIPPENHNYVFEKFRSMDSGKSKIIQGTGLGLPICKAIIEQHGGQIGLESEPGKGSTFFFTLVEVAEDEKAVHPPEVHVEAA